MSATSQATPAASKSGQSKQSTAGVAILRRWGTIAVVVLTAAGFSVASPWFFSVSNLNNILYTMIVSAFVSMGLTFVVVAGSFDLSVGLVVTTTSIVTALLIPTTGALLASLGGLAVAAFIGVLNGLLVTKGRLSGIVVTLGMMFVLEGVNTFLSAGYQVPVSYDEKAFLFFGQGHVGPFNACVIFLFVAFAITQYIASKTRVGYYIEAVGDNPFAAYYSGIRVYFWVVMSFVIAEVMAGIGGILLTSISTSAQPVGGEGYLLESFAAVYLGATVLGRGKPHVFGTLIGMFFIYMVNSGMSMAAFPYAARQLFAGLILIIAVGANAALNREEIHLKFI
jgi:ribose/xylose/arabinose/galactoside ABC-type transport system permease subunit